ncbi:MAG TPA: SWIM zinc finger family protein [Natronosporangium sp.]
MTDQSGRPWPPRAKPIRVTGGIKARTTRGAIGRSWWSKRFLAVLESFPFAGRLARGRSYARAGQVIALTVGPGEVTSTVQGSRTDPYQVSIKLAPIPALAWARVEVALAEQAIYSARLLAGEMPPDIEDVFTAAGAPLFPQQQRDLRMRCSCPDYAVPCKHLAATFYLLAEAFDDDPFQILHWRGRDRESLLARLRELRDPGAASAAPAAEPAGPVAGAALALAELTTPTLAESLDRLALDRFWLPPVPLPDRPPTLDTEPDLLLRQLPVPGAAIGGTALLDALRPAYQRFAGADATDE